MPLRTVDNSVALERSLQTNVYDLHSSSVALDMHDVFVRRAKQVLSLLTQVAGKAIAEKYQKRFYALMDGYERLGMPKHLGDESARAYLARVRQFSDDLRAFIEAAYPIKVEFSPSSVLR